VVPAGRPILNAGGLDRAGRTRQDAWGRGVPATKFTVSALPATHRRFLPVLGVLFVVWWIGWAINPLHPDDWWLENVLVGIGLPLLLFTARWFVLSRTSYLLAFLFLCLHTLGAHYTSRRSGGRAGGGGDLDGGGEGSVGGINQSPLRFQWSRGNFICWIAHFPMR